MPNVVKFKRGLKAGLPTLPAGEPGYCTDSRDMYVGAGARNVLIGPVNNAGLLENLELSATVASNALTVSIRNRAGNNPTTSDAVRIAFRKEALANGGYDVLELTAALSLVLSAGSTLGFSGNEPGRIYLWALNNAGAMKIAISRTADIWQETNLHTTVAEGGAGAADSPAILYSDAIYTAKAIRCIGYVEIQSGSPAGNWGNAPSKVQVMGPGIRRTGEIVQSVVTVATAYDTATSANVIPLDDTIPQSSEGRNYSPLDTAITPSSPLNTLRVDLGINLSHNGTGAIIALFRDAGASAICATASNANISHRLVAGSAAATTFKVNYSPISSRLDGTWVITDNPPLRKFLQFEGDPTAWINGRSGSRVLGGVSASTMTVTEVFA